MTWLLSFILSLHPHLDGNANRTDFLESLLRCRQLFCPVVTLAPVFKQDLRVHIFTVDESWGVGREDVEDTIIVIVSEERNSNFFYFAFKFFGREGEFMSIQ